MYPKFFRTVVAPGRPHPQSFHLGALHYHFTPTGGSVLIVIFIFLLVGGTVAAMLRSS